MIHDVMTKLMEQAINRLRALPAEKQDSVAGIVLAELDGDGEWERRLSTYSPALEALGDQALEEHRQGKTKPLPCD